MRETILLWCQHSIGMGHLVRSFAIAEALADRFHVVVACGGVLPNGLAYPHEVEIVSLPAVELGANGALKPANDADALAQVFEERLRTLCALAERHRPAALVLELYPFGRKKHAVEIDTLVRHARARRSDVVVVSSVRDILVGGRPDQQRHDDRACQVANDLLDAVFVHSDPAIARLEDSFHPCKPLEVPVFYTGYVERRRRPANLGRREQSPQPPSRSAPAMQSRTGGGPPARDRASDGMQPEPHVLVSAGGGRAGTPLFLAAAEASPILYIELGLRTRVVAGPLCDPSTYAELERRARRLPELELVSSVPDLLDELRTARVSISQCGYNTVLDIARARTPAVVVPFHEGNEDEQMRRAELLSRRGVVEIVDPKALSTQTLVEAVGRALDRPVPTFELARDGARRTAELLEELVRGARNRARIREHREMPRD